ncbi:MAG: hypothetical protein IPL79_12590 [Myxococcales bacterium]|nr:hypothetical protein [Myxococcales bacterium]
MRQPVISLVVLVFASAWGACGVNSEPASKPDAAVSAGLTPTARKPDLADKAAAPRVANAMDRAATGGGNRCLAQFATKLDQLLPLEEAAALAGLPAPQGKMAYTRAANSPAQDFNLYTWPRDKAAKGKAAGARLVGVGLVSEQTSAQFATAYGLGAAGMQAVADVGEAASWEAGADTLHIWAGGTAFAVKVTVADDDALNLARAVDVATSVLLKCNL